MAKKDSQKHSPINFVFFLFIAGAIVFASFTGTMKEVTDASFESAKSAVTLAISLVGIMAFWLGMVRILEAGGLLHQLAKLLKPLMIRLFPDVPEDHPAVGAMILNVSANMLGLGNAATPFGIKAMVELNKLNPFPGTATNAMCLFLAINTSSVALLPLGVIGVRAAAGAKEPAAIWIPTMLATLASTIVAIGLSKLLAKDVSEETSTSEAQKVAEEIETKEADYSHLVTKPRKVGCVVSYSLMALFFAGLIFSIATADSKWEFFTKELSAYWLMPCLMLLILCYGVLKGVRVYEAVTEGAKQGFDIAIRIIPFLVAILAAIGMFRASGAMELLAKYISPITAPLGMPAEALPMALIRPLSGSGAFGVMSELINQNPDSYEAFVASTMMGSTETTFYVLAVYFGAAGVTRIRHALVAALAADATGILVACAASAYFY